MALNRDSNPDVDKLKVSLIHAVESGKVVCPAHFNETVFESVKMPPEKCRSIIQLQNKLSCGVAFTDFAERLSQETLAMVRPTAEIIPFRFRPMNMMPAHVVASLGSANRKAIQEYVERVDKVPYPPTAYRPTHKLKDIFADTSKERAASMYRIAEALSNRSLNTGKKEWEFAQVTGRYLREHQITRLECFNLMDKILKHDWEVIPVLGLHTILWSGVESAMLKSNKKFAGNDYVDILRLATALDSANLIACDAAMKEMIQQTGLDELVLVFALRDMSAFISWLESL